jgi:tetrahydromethanopterin S-methyltransferase subunit G
MQAEQTAHIKVQKDEEDRIEARIDKLDEKIDRLYKIIIDKLGN